MPLLTPLLVLCIAVGAILPALWPLVSIATAELKPRSVFVAEKAMTVPSNFRTTFSSAHVRSMHALGAGLSAINASQPVQVAAWVARQLPPPWKVHLQHRKCVSHQSECSAGAPNVIALLPGTRGVAGESVLLSSDYPASYSNASLLTPHGLILALSLARVLALAPWRARDTLLVISLDADSRIPTNRGGFLAPVAMTAPALDDAIAALAYDPGRAACKAAREWAWQTGALLDWLALLLNGESVCAQMAVPLREVTRAFRRDAGPLPPGFGGLRVISGAVAFSFAPSNAALTSVEVGVHGYGGRLPELDLVALAVGALSPPHTVARPTAAAKGEVDLAVRRRLRWLALGIMRVVNPAVQWLTAAAGIPCGDVDKACISRTSVVSWANSCGELFSFWLQSLAGPSGPQGALLSGGMDAISLRGISGALEKQGVHSADAANNGLVAFGSALERIIRSLHNLDERLHANTRSYMVFSPGRFVGLPEIALVLIPCVVIPVVGAGLLGGIPRMVAFGAASCSAWLLVAACWGAGLLVSRAFAALEQQSVGASDDWAPWLLPTGPGVLLGALSAMEVVAAALSAAVNASILWQCHRSRAELADSGNQRFAPGSPLHGVGWPLVFFAWLLYGYAALALVYSQAGLALLAILMVLPLLAMHAVVGGSRPPSSAAAVLRLVGGLLTTPVAVDAIAVCVIGAPLLAPWMAHCIAHTPSQPLPVSAAAVVLVVVIPIHGILLAASFLDVAHMMSSALALPKHT